MSKYTFLLLSLNYCLFINTASGYEFYSKDADGTKHINVPFLTHVSVKKHADGTHDVDVKAPFVKVHNPAGPGNTDVKAPFTKVSPKKTAASTSTCSKPAPKNVVQ